MRFSITIPVLAALSLATAQTQTLWGQCGGSPYTGPTICESGTYCFGGSIFYSQCVPGPAPSTTTTKPTTTTSKSTTKSTTKTSASTTKVSSSSLPPVTTTATPTLSTTSSTRVVVTVTPPPISDFPKCIRPGWPPNCID